MFEVRGATRTYAPLLTTYGREVQRTHSQRSALKTGSSGSGRGSGSTPSTAAHTARLGDGRTIFAENNDSEQSWFFNQSGTVVALPVNLTVPMARQLARLKQTHAVRYCIDRVYRTRRGAGAGASTGSVVVSSGTSTAVPLSSSGSNSHPAPLVHPRESLEAVFDVVKEVGTNCLTY